MALYCIRLFDDIQNVRKALSDIRKSGDSGAGLSIFLSSPGRDLRLKRIQQTLDMLPAFGDTLDWHSLGFLNACACAGPLAKILTGINNPRKIIDNVQALIAAGLSEAEADVVAQALQYNHHVIAVVTEQIADSQTRHHSIDRILAVNSGRSVEDVWNAWTAGGWIPAVAQLQGARLPATSHPPTTSATVFLPTSITPQTHATTLIQSSDVIEKDITHRSASNNSNIPLQEIIVSKKGNQGFRTITDAIAHASPNGKIRVLPGIYQESIEIDKTIDIFADGAPGSIIIDGGTSNCMLISSGNLNFRGFTFRNESTVNAVVVTDGQVYFDSCHFSSQDGPSLGVAGSETIVTLHQCSVKDSRSSGIVVTEQAKLILTDCDISNNQKYGVAVSKSSNVLALRCTIQNNREFGIYFEEFSIGNVEECNIYNNHDANVIVTTNAIPTLRRCKIHDSRKMGVVYLEGGGGELEDCTIYNCTQAGITVSQGSSPLIRKCSISDQRSGIFVNTGGMPVIEDCNIQEHTIAGIGLNGSQCTVRRTKIHGGNIGILMSEGSRDTIEDCELFHQLTASIQVGINSNPIIRRCHMHDGQAGIVFAQDAIGSMEDCVIYSFSTAGILLDGCNNSQIHKCSITFISGIVIKAINGAKARVHECDLTKNNVNIWDIEQGCFINQHTNGLLQKPILSQVNTGLAAVSASTMTQSSTPIQPIQASFVPQSSQFSYHIDVSAKILKWPRQCVCCLEPSTTVRTVSYTRTTGKKVQRSTTRGWDVPYCRTCVEHVGAVEKARNMRTALIAAAFIQMLALGCFIQIWWPGLIIGCLVIGFAIHKYVNQDLPAAQQLMQAKCCDVDVAVRYDGWYGSIHTFYFKHYKYAENFELVNKSKVLG